MHKGVEPAEAALWRVQRIAEDAADGCVVWARVPIGSAWFCYSDVCAGQANKGRRNCVFCGQHREYG